MRLLSNFLQVAAGAADIPVTRLLGQSPAGLSAMGESDTRNYYDHVAARQEIDLRPKLEWLDRLILRSAGLDPGALSFDFRPLWQMDAAASAAIALQKAQASQIYAGLGVWPADTVARLVQSQLIEDSTYPGAERIFAEAFLSGAQPTADFDPNQPRDLEGRWTSAGGGASAESGPNEQAPIRAGGGETSTSGYASPGVSGTGTTVPIGHTPDGTPIEAAAFRNGRGKQLARALGAMLGAAARVLRRWLPEEPDDVSKLPSSPSPSPSSSTPSGQPGSNAPSSLPSAAQAPSTSPSQAQGGPAPGSGGPLNPSALSRLQRYGDARNTLTAVDPGNPELAALAAVAPPGYVPSEADIAKIEAAAEAASIKRVKDFLLPNGQPIGSLGKRSDIRELPGGLPEAQKDFDYISVDGTPVLFMKGSFEHAIACRRYQRSRRAAYEITLSRV